ncbi:hypothetical protein Q5M85_03535 [Paraclostridium bifermentans]|nr:hypothetical protein [Paraclostridium bifermentans]
MEYRWLNFSKNVLYNFVEPHLVKNEKVFVIISDALRYDDCAKELCDILNIERKGTAYDRCTTRSFTFLYKN